MTTIRTSLAALLVALSLPLWAQDVDYDQIVPPEGTDSLTIEERLVQLAWRNSPEASRGERQVVVAGKQMRLAKNQWLNNIAAAGNLNQFVIENALNSIGNRNQDQGQQAIPNLFPLYNVGVNIPLGIFSQRRNSVAIAKEQKAIAEDDINQLKLDLRAQVLSRYRLYLLRKETLELHGEILQDITVRHKSAQTMFRDGKMKFDEFDQINQAYNSERLRRLSLESDLDLAKIDLERLIGVRLEQVLKR
jgi:outer membrane protein TolC